MSQRESYLTFPDQKDANARFYTRVGTPKYLITKPIENQVNIVTMLVTRIKAWKSRNQWRYCSYVLSFTIMNWLNLNNTGFNTFRSVFKTLILF